jgi:predicted ATPase
MLCAAACATPTDRAIVQPSAYSAPVVLFVQPDSGEVQRLRAEMGDEAFYVAADDAMWYQASALELLDSLGIRHAIASRGEARFRVRGTTVPFAWKAVDRTWFLVVYDGERMPEIVPSVDLREHVARLRRGR